MIVQNNILPNNIANELEEALSSPHFPWFFQPFKVSTTKQEDPRLCQFTHVFFIDNKNNSPHFALVEPILTFIKPRALIRIKANLTVGNVDQIQSGMHTDSEYEDGKTAIYYVNSNNGYTIFEEDNKKIYSEKNKLVTFQSTKKHCGVTCSDRNIRIVLNFNYF